MPRGQKYILPYKTFSGRNITIYFNFKSYGVGSPTTTLKGGPEPFSLSNQNSDENILVGIRGQEATITYINEGSVTVTEFASDDDEEVEVIIEDTDLLQVIWTGFIVQDDCREPFMPAPKYVTLRATDNLGLLKDLEFRDLSNNKIFDKILLTQYFNILLNKTGLSLLVNTFCNVFENGMNDRSISTANDPFAQTKVHTRTFTKDADSFEDCFTVLSRILEAWECQLFQHLGQWFIVRWPELKDFNNLIPGTSYASDLTLPTATVLPATIALGKTQNIKFCNANQTKSILRAIKHDKLTFNYEQPHKLILNDDFKKLGTLITTYTVGTDTYKEYQLPDWSDGSFTPHPTFFIRVITNQYGVEKDRYAVLNGSTGDASRSVQSTAFEINKGDKFVLSFQWRTSDSQPGNVNVVFAVSITDGVTTNYLQSDGSWATTTGFTFNVPSGDNTNEWHTVEMETKTLPFDGTATVWLAQNSASGAETRYKSLDITYYTFINDSTGISGQYHKSEQPVKIIKKNIENQIYLDDSPKNNIRGTMFLADGTTKTNIWHRGTATETLQFGFIQKIDLMKLNYMYRTRIEGDATGIYSGGYLGLLTIFTLDDLPNKFFIMSNVRINFKAEKWSGVIQEIWDNTETVADADFTNTFSYIYKSQ